MFDVSKKCPIRDDFITPTHWIGNYYLALFYEMRNRFMFDERTENWWKQNTCLGRSLKSFEEDVMWNGNW